MPNLELDKKLIVPVVGFTLAVLICLFMIIPLFNAIGPMDQELKMLEREMADARQAIDAYGSIQHNGHLLTRKEVSRAIDEITKVGAAFNIDFRSTSPQKIGKEGEQKYPVLPIEMDIQSEYKDLGIFLGALEELQESILTVKSFQIDLDEEIIPQVRTRLMVQIYLRKGEDG